MDEKHLVQQGIERIIDCPFPFYAFPDEPDLTLKVNVLRVGDGFVPLADSSPVRKEVCGDGPEYLGQLKKELAYALMKTRQANHCTMPVIKEIDGKRYMEAKPLKLAYMD